MRLKAHWSMIITGHDIFPGVSTSLCWQHKVIKQAPGCASGKKQGERLTFNPPFEKGQNGIMLYYV